MTHVKILFKWVFVLCLVGVGSMLLQSGIDFEKTAQWAGTWFSDSQPIRQDAVEIADQPAGKDGDQRAEAAIVLHKDISNT